MGSAKKTYIINIGFDETLRCQISYINKEGGTSNFYDYIWLVYLHHKCQ